MSHQTFKVSIIIEEMVENFYIKHYVDDFQPIFEKFKYLVFKRNPNVNSPMLKVYWIDAENDKILISCEEDFRLFIEQGSGKKIFFSVVNSKPTANEDDDDCAMDAEVSNERQKNDRKQRKSTRDEEKQKRAAKRLAEKMRHAEEKVRSEEERCSKHPEKYERKNAERLERAKKRCEQIRQIIGSMDPANLNSTAESSINAGASSSQMAQISSDPMAILHPSPETIRLLSNAIAGCLQPCSLINKILNEIIGMVPQPAAETATQASPQTSSDQQQQTEFPRQNSATNTSEFSTPVTGHPSSQEIEALFKEAAQELEKMNEIVNANKSMEGSTNTLASSFTGVTQIERVFHNITDSAISNVTIVNNETPETYAYNDNVDGEEKHPESFKIITPPKSMRSRESSIEVHDVNSMMSDDSRDWTLLDAAGNEQGEEDSLMTEKGDISIPPARVVNQGTGAIPKGTSNPFEEPTAEPSEAEIKLDSIKSVSSDSQKEASLLSNVAAVSIPSAEEVNASIRKSIETVGKMNEIVKNSVASAQQSLNTMPQPVDVVPIPKVVTPAPLPAPKVPVELVFPRFDAPLASNHKLTFPPSHTATTPTTPIAAPRPSSSDNFIPNPNLKWKTASGKVGPAIIVYDPNPKINAAVHTMVNMGFTNEGGWLTQLLINVDGDVAQAINFLTPQPKNKQQ